MHTTHTQPTPSGSRTLPVGEQLPLHVPLICTFPRCHLWSSFWMYLWCHGYCGCWRLHLLEKEKVTIAYINKEIFYDGKFQTFSQLEGTG